MIINDLDIRIINPATGELLRQLTLDPARDYQPQTRTCPPRGFAMFLCLATSQRGGFARFSDLGEQGIPE